MDELRCSVDVIANRNGDSDVDGEGTEELDRRFKLPTALPLRTPAHVGRSSARIART